MNTNILETMDLVTTGGVITMSSLQVVDYINHERKQKDGEKFTELAHSDFLKKVPLVLGEKDAGNFSSIYKDSMNRSKPCFNFPKREAILMVMSYSYDLQAKVYDRMTALEERLLTQSPKQLTNGEMMADIFNVMKLIGLDNNAAAISANRYVKHKTGDDLLLLTGNTHLLAEKQDDVAITPTAVGDLLGGWSAQAVNKVLGEMGYQSKIGGKWVATDDGKPYSRMFDTNKKRSDGTPVTQLKWYSSVANEIIKHQGDK